MINYLSLQSDDYHAHRLPDQTIDNFFIWEELPFNSQVINDILMESGIDKLHTFYIEDVYKVKDIFFIYGESIFYASIELNSEPIPRKVIFFMAYGLISQSYSIYFINTENKFEKKDNIPINILLNTYPVILDKFYVDIDMDFLLINNVFITDALPHPLLCDLFNKRSSTFQIENQIEFDSN